MIYLVGGAPRAGKSIFAQKIAAKLKIGWVSTDLLLELLRVSNVAGVKAEWDAEPAAITAAAEWFFPYLERFAWGVNSLSEGYVIEGVDFLPAQAAQLAAQFQVHAVFLGCSQMTLERFEQFPGHSRGYASLPDEFKQQIVQDVPLWSAFIQQEAQRLGLPYVDMSDDFPVRLIEAEAALLKN